MAFTVKTSSFKERVRVGGVALCALLLVSGCILADKRVGVVSMPSVVGNASDSKPSEDRQGLPTHVAILPLTNSTNNPEAARLVRRTLFNHFSSKNYYARHWRDVDRLLAAAAWDPTQPMDGPAIQKVADTLGVDAVILGEVTHYDKIFAALYSQVSVGVKLRFVSRDGKEVWQGEHVTRKHEGGLPTTPVGLIMQTVASAMNVRDINLFRISDELGREVMAKIPEPKHLGRPPTLNITQVVHDGTNRFLRYGDLLSIAMEGAAGHKGYVRIQGLPLVPMSETAPGMYHVQMAVAPEMNIDQVVVIGVLENAHGVRSERIATTGYVFVDNTPPGPVSDLTASGRDDTVVLAWTSPPDADVVSFDIRVGSTAQGTFEPLTKVSGNRFEHRGIGNFMPRYYQVISLDRAGNAGTPVVIAGRGVPDPRFEQATPLPQDVPATLEGLHVLTAQGGPYRVRDVVTVTESGVLLVEPGTEIRLNATGVLRVHGELKVFGEKERLVKVEGMYGMFFHTFLELHGERPVLVEGVEIRQASMPIMITRGTPQISNVHIFGSRFNAFDIKGIAQPWVRNSEVRDSHGGVAVITGRARPRFEGNTFVNNGPVHMQCTSPYAIEARHNIWKQPRVSKRSLLLGNGCTFLMD